VSDVTEKVGEVEVLLGESVVASGTYNLVIEPHPPGGRKQESRRPARGTLRLREGHSAHRAMAAPTVRIRLDRAVDITVEVHLYVPGASFVAFTCDDCDALAQLGQSSAATE
jgi:hypothetical protein